MLDGWLSWDIISYVLELQIVVYFSPCAAGVMEVPALTLLLPDGADISVSSTKTPELTMASRKNIVMHIKKW